MVFKDAVRLRIKSAPSLQTAYQFDILSLPVANFTSDITTGNVPLTVNFSDLSTNTPTYWEWDFGDGSPKSYAQNPAHTYNKSGVFTVTLTVSNASGSDTEIKTDYVTVVNNATANLTMPSVKGIAEAWGANLVFPKPQGVSGYWTDPARMTIHPLTLLAIAVKISNDGDFKLPLPNILASGSIGEVANVNASLPSFTLSSKDPDAGSVSVTIPLPSIKASVLIGSAGSTHVTLPSFYTEGWADVIGVSNVIATLPDFELYADALIGHVGISKITTQLPRVEGSGYNYLNIIGDALLMLPLISLRGAGFTVLTNISNVFTINTKNLAVSEYLNYGFNSFCKFNGVYLGAKEDGIFLLDGNNDNGTNIQSKLVTGLLHLEQSNIRRIINLIFGMVGQGSYEIRLINENGDEYSYSFINDSDVFRPVRVKTGRGKPGKYWTLKFLNESGSTFIIDSIEADIEPLRRRLH